MDSGWIVPTILLMAVVSGLGLLVLSDFLKDRKPRRR